MPAIVQFTNTGAFTWEVPEGVSSVNVLVVAGGGGGGNGGNTSGGGGGGGGGVIYTENYSVTGSISGSVGAGGAANTKGNNSHFGSIVAEGGGKGGTLGDGGDGGNGGGGAYSSNTATGKGGTGSIGFDGGNGDDYLSSGPRKYSGGGGGGAGQSGFTGAASNKIDGGNGLAFDISGTSTYYGGGGGGGDRGFGGAYASRLGGLGGGGNGSLYSTGVYNGSNGQANTGGGGGGATGPTSARGGSGGSGIVIISYIGSPSDEVIADGDLITISQSVGLTVSGNINNIAQTVAWIANGNLISVEQAVDLRLTGSGGLVSLGQTVNATISGNLNRIAQLVRATVAPTEYEPPFDLELIVGSLTIPCNQIHGSISITRAESSAALMNVTLIPPKGVQNITQYQGKPIILNYIANGVSTRIYTGKVDIPEVDILRQTITLRCTDNRTEQNNALSRSFVTGIGQYSEAVFGEAKDQNDEIEKRLRTVQASLDYDANGLVTFTDWTPKATADFVFDDPDIYRRTPQVEVLSRGRVINKVNLDLAYRWVRLRHRERDWEWEFIATNENNWCQWLADRTPLCRAEGPRSAAESAGWAIKEYDYTGLPKAGWYRCQGNFGSSLIGWTPINRTCGTQEKKDDNGNTVTDSDGNAVSQAVNCTTIDDTLNFATSAQWTAAKRWAQTVEQKVSYVITAPQSIGQYGVVERDERAGVEFNYDAQSWESMTNYQPPLGIKSPNGDWIIDQRSGGLGEFSSAVSCARAKAVADILGSHRQNYVTLQLPMQPAIDLRHTIETTAGKIRCKGKVYQIQHKIDVGDKFAETQIQIALSRAEGAAATSLQAVNLTPPVDQSSNPSKFMLGNWIGGRVPIQYVGPPSGGQVDRSDTTITGLPKGAQGFITNYVSKQTGPLFTVSFIVDTPEIEDAARDTFETQSTQQNTIAIRNDLLEVVFDE